MSEGGEISAVNAFMCSDGLVFTDKKEAINHETRIVVRDKIIEWVETYCWDGMGKMDITTTIIEELHNLRCAINSEKEPIIK